MKPFVSFVFLATVFVFTMSYCHRQQVVLILLGAPGAGKGTQAAYLSETLHIPQISTGNLFRENLRLNTPIGKKAKKYMEQGKLVPDEVVLDMLFERLQALDCKSGYILDGFPRTIHQAEILDTRLAKYSTKVIAISLEVPDEVIIERLAERIVCEKCSAPYHKEANPPKLSGVCDQCGSKLIQRKDDTKDVVLERLKGFHEQTAPLKIYYQKKGSLILIDGTKTKETTTFQIDTQLKKSLDS